MSLTKEQKMKIEGWRDQQRLRCGACGNQIVKPREERLPGEKPGGDVLEDLLALPAINIEDGEMVIPGEGRNIIYGTSVFAIACVKCRSLTFFPTEIVGLTKPWRH